MEKGVKEIISSQQKKSNENIKINIGLPLIECTYDIKDTNLVQIMNDRGITSINEEVVLTLFILNIHGKMCESCYKHPAKERQ